MASILYLPELQIWPSFRKYRIFEGFSCAKYYNHGFLETQYTTMNFFRKIGGGEAPDPGCLARNDPAFSHVMIAGLADCYAWMPANKNNDKEYNWKHCTFWASTGF